MFNLGTAHIIISPSSNRFTDDRLFDILLSYEQYPRRVDWNVLNLQYPNNESVDYELVLDFDYVDVSWDQVNKNTCINIKDIKVGVREEQVWSVKDSAMVVSATRNLTRKFYYDLPSELD